MNTRLLAIAVLIGVALLVLTLPPTNHQNTVILLLDQDQAQVEFQTNSGSVLFDVEIADEPGEWGQGLMFRESLPEDAGMLFIFPDETLRSFWMKNTLIPLDIIFISTDLEIVHIAHAIPCETDPCASYSSLFPAQYVVEINGDLSDELGI